MDAKNILVEISEAFAHARLEAVMIGNAAAAIQEHRLLQWILISASWRLMKLYQN